MKTLPTAFAAALAALASIAACGISPAEAQLRSDLARYGMTSGKSSLATDGVDVTVRWVARRPGPTSQKLPVLVFLPGLGELGPDLSQLFRNRGVFDMVTSPEFQKKHPCAFVALQTEEGVERHCLEAGLAAPSLAAMWAALEDALAKIGNSRIDRRRIYLTGLSAGGGACCSMMCAYPGRFAAAVPIAAVIHPRLFSRTVPENIWAMYNSGELEQMRKFVDVDALSREMASRGGEFKLGELPGEGHNAWTATWRENAVWDWMFSKRAATAAPNAASARAEAGRRLAEAALSRDGWKCTASVKAESQVALPRFGADGLDGTAFRSAAAAKKGDWWQVEFPSPRKGPMRILTGDGSGRGKVLRGTVLVSVDGRNWSRAVAVSDGTASFRADRAVRFVRLRVDANQSGPFAVRELEVR